jgi:alpha-L-fucosidase
LQWKQLASTQLKKVRMSKSQTKKMLITFFDINCSFRFEFIPQGQTVNQAYFVETLKRLREAVRRKRPELWPNDWSLHHDNAPAHKALSVKEFLAQKSIT